MLVLGESYTQKNQIFNGGYLIPQKHNNKKQVKKIYDLLADIYVHGDKEAVNAELALLCAAAYDDETVENNIYEMLSVNNHFLQGFGNLLISFKSNKKLKVTMLNND